MEDALDDHGLELALDERRAEADAGTAVDGAVTRRGVSRASGSILAAATSLVFGVIGALRAAARRARGRDLARQLPDEDKPWT